MMKKIEMKPCPFCKSGKSRLVADDRREDAYVLCTGCRSRGPTFDYEEAGGKSCAKRLAKGSWDRRAKY